MCPRTCALGLSSSLLSENKKKTTKVCEIGDRESFFGALFILWIHGKNSHIRTTCKLGGHDLQIIFSNFKCWTLFSLFGSRYALKKKANSKGACEVFEVEKKNTQEKQKKNKKNTKKTKKNTSQPTSSL